MNNGECLTSIEPSGDRVESRCPDALDVGGGDSVIRGVFSDVRRSAGFARIAVDWSKADRGVAIDSVRDPNEEDFDYAKNNFTDPTVDIDDWLSRMFPSAANFKNLTAVEREETAQLRDALRLSRKFMQRIVDFPCALENGAWDATVENGKSLASILSLGKVEYRDAVTEKIAHSNQAIAFSELVGILVSMMLPGVIRTLGYGGLENETLALNLGNYASCVPAYVLMYKFLTRKMSDYSGRQAAMDGVKMEIESAVPTLILYYLQAKLMALFTSMGVENPEVIVAILGYLFYSSAMYNAAAVTFDERDGAERGEDDVKSFIDDLYRKYQGVIGYDGLPIVR